MRKLFCWMLLGLSVAGAWAAPEAAVRQVFRPERLEAGATNIKVVQPIDEAAWIWMKGEDVWGAEALAADAWADPPPPPCSRFYRFRRAFVSDGTPLALDVSADERFVLKLDGAFVARGPYRGFVNRWNYQTYTLNLAPGEHVLEASVAKLGWARPAAQTTWKAGFVLKASGTYDAQLTTGKAAWQAADLKGTTLRPDKTSNTLGLVGGTFRVENSEGTVPLLKLRGDSPSFEAVTAVVSRAFRDGALSCAISERASPPAEPFRRHLPVKLSHWHRPTDSVGRLLVCPPRRTGPYAACLRGSSQMNARQRFTDRLPAFGKCLGRKSLTFFRKPKSAEM